MVGFARTVRYLPLREDLFPARSKGFNAQKRAVDGVQPGDVLVISARGVADAGTIGDILALRVQVLGGAGIVTDGPVRDGAAIDGLDIPTFTIGHHPAPLGVRHTPWETDVAVACAGALVEPGDLLVGDDDGVVVLPDALITEIVADAVRQEAEERFIAEQVEGGASVDGLYPMNAEWRSRWEARDDEA
jgi:regulator of RNase E activity RraA